MKEWRLTPEAEQQLASIAEWTARRFGRAKALAYRDALIDRIKALAAGQPPQARSCEVLMRGKGAVEGLAYYREGGHFIILRETADRLDVLDFVHGNRDLDSLVAKLAARGEETEQPGLN